MWQDYLFLLGGIIFAITLLPSVFSKNKPNKLTSFLTSLFLYAYAFAYSTLNLYWASLTTFITASIWFVLCWQAANKKE